MKEFKLPDLGEGVHEGQVVRLFVAQGATIKEDEPLLEVETDKASVEIPSPVTGTIAKWHCAENELVHVGDVMVTFGSTDESSATLNADRGTVAAAASATRAPATQSTEGKTTGRAPSGGPRRASPAVRKLARSLGVDLNVVDATGNGGRVTRADVERAANGSTDQSVATASSSAQPARSKSNVPHTPVRDAEPLVTAPPATWTLPDGDDEQGSHGPVRRVRNSMARRTIAANMAQSWSSIPHVTDCQDADITHLDKIRRGYPAPENNEQKITVLSFVVRAVAQALTRHPVFNAVFDADADSIVYHRYVNIAIGVHTPRGLMTPVIRDADRLSIRAVAQQVDAISAKVRGNSFDVADLRGGTYTISNVGAVGSNRYSTPIVPPGQSSVLALGRAKLQPWVVDGEIVPRLILPLSHSFDHRIADGGDEVAFLGEVVSALENPARILI